MEEKRTVRSLETEAKVIDSKRGVVDYIASDQTVDHYNEVILVNGWRFDYFQKNAPFVDSHDYGRIEKLLGRVESWKVQGKKLVERVVWAIDTGSALAKLGFDLTEKGYLKAVSVGFIPKKWAHVSGDAEQWKAACEEAGLKKDNPGNCRCIYLEHQQIELSACIIGANPNALLKAHKAGDLKDEGLATLGLDSTEGYSFLERSAALVESGSCDEWMRSLISLEMRRCYDSAGGTTPRHKTASSAGKPGGADEAQRQASREEFLRRLGA
jgi:hypothetical protein